MARNSTYLTLFLLLLLTVPLPARAQSGSCPDYTNELSPSPTGTYPSNTKFCAGKDSSATFGIVYGDEYPCSTAINVGSTVGAVMKGEFDPLLIVPPSAMPFSAGYANMRFEFHPAGFFGEYTQDVLIKIESYSPTGVLRAQTVFNVRDHPSVVSQFGNTWYLPELQLAAEQNGYFTLQVVAPTPTSLADYFISGLQITDSSGFPATCQIPGGGWPTATPSPTPIPPPATNTPQSTPQNTPTGTWQPTATATNTPQNTPQNTPTAWPTSPGGTFTPWPSATPYTPQEIDAEPTGTPLPLPFLPDIGFPSVNLPGDIGYGNAPMPGNIGFPSFPPPEHTSATYPEINVPSVPIFSTPDGIGVSLTPNATTEAKLIEVRGWISNTEETVDRWSGATAAGLGWLNPDITSTTGISSPMQIAAAITEPITLPISYVRSLSVYVPHIWPYIFLIFLMLLWIFFNLMAKFGLAIISEILDVIRRVIELIPGF